MKINSWWKDNQIQRVTINKATSSYREPTYKHWKHAQADKIKNKTTILKSKKIKFIGSKKQGRSKPVPFL